MRATHLVLSLEHVLHQNSICRVFNTTQFLQISKLGSQAHEMSTSTKLGVAGLLVAQAPIRKGSRKLASGRAFLQGYWLASGLDRLARDCGTGSRVSQLRRDDVRSDMVSSCLGSISNDFTSYMMFLTPQLFSDSFRFSD